MVSPCILRGVSKNSPPLIACANVSFCSLPPRHQQDEKMVVAMFWPKMPWCLQLRLVDSTFLLLISI